MLTEEQVLQYKLDGFVSPIRVLTHEEAQANLDELERMESAIGAPLSKAEKKWRGGSYAYAPWVDRLVRHPRVLDAVEAVIGPDILVFWSTFFIKEPNSPSFTSWHQDATYFGLDPYEHVTAWIALTNASMEAGCLEVLPERGVPKQLQHFAARHPDSINGAGQTIVESLEDSGAVAMPLRPGEMSLHHTLCPHRSGPNRSTHRRIGLGVSYIPAHVRHSCSVRMSAMLVRGQNTGGHFDLLPRPNGEMDEAALNAHDAVTRPFRTNYDEQVAAHEAQTASVRSSRA